MSTGMIDGSTFCTVVWKVPVSAFQARRVALLPVGPVGRPARQAAFRLLHRSDVWTARRASGIIFNNTALERHFRSVHLPAGAARAALWALEAVRIAPLKPEQFRIAEGGLLDPEDPVTHGHSIEFRINGEDPGRNFMPTPGPVHVLRFPGGPGVGHAAAADRSERAAGGAAGNGGTAGLAGRASPPVRPRPRAAAASDAPVPDRTRAGAIRTGLYF